MSEREPEPQESSEAGIEEESYSYSPGGEQAGPVETFSPDIVEAYFQSLREERQRLSRPKKLNRTKRVLVLERRAFLWQREMPIGYREISFQVALGMVRLGEAVLVEAP